METFEKSVIIPDYEHIDSNDIRDALVIELRKTKNKITLLISDVAGGDKSEIDRIDRAFSKIMYQTIQNNIDDVLGDSDARDLSCLDDNEPTLIEGYLSGARASCGFCVYDLRDMDFSEVFASFANANYFLGMAEGCDRTEAMSDQKMRAIQQKAASIRHAENRSMKDVAIQYYKDNHKSFSNKDDAAIYISANIVPSAFSTVRGWLKGVKSE